MGKNLREPLLKLLIEQKEGYISGEEISQRLICSRTAIWKHINELRSEGYQIEAKPKAGYRLVYRPDRVAPEELIPHLSTTSIGRAVRYQRSVPSTQSLAHEWAKEGAQEGSLYLTEEQTAGRGRMGRIWHSPTHSGIWMSLILRPPIPLNQSPQLTLLTSVAITRALRKQTNLPIQIKWPNDLLIHGKKVCGILTELRGEQDQVHYVVQGIGINVNATESVWPEELRPIATSLAIEGGRTFSRPELIGAICGELETLYDGYLSYGFTPIRILWEEYAGMLGQEVTARTGQGSVKGIAKGLAETGALLLETHTGVQTIFSSDIEW
ncbi:biotin--[acetyl-CoA-carboxylase] ligase [Marininema halotolerans]|uniref:Bifunctional ligase/repressor BirA n=1 Tax=Marininema halotolerans TaxID=1155944 RepID=A0A1I6U0H6_9BACL|nr:biotin--[acetyl-CoA-carboxylase] ligase [Marininema halotolerans]SFS94932.1 BirA family transcriptional regulator, biotin operon repressor / biotin-[acetyl-CoA-carboxylase] ligase [Marininema halotolerans]